MVAQPVDPEVCLSSDITVETDTTSLESLIDKYPVIVFSKSTCPFCIELKRMLSTYGVHYQCVELDQTNKMKEYQLELKDKYGISTVPALFVDKKLVGGCTAAKELEFKGDFQNLITKHVTKDIPHETRVSRFNFFYFPESVNKNAVRVSGLLSMIYAILCVGFYNRRETKWFVLAIAIDYFLRIIFGGNGAPIGMIANVIVAPFPPVFSAGPPKQFAACCGWFMTALSAALYLSGQQLGGVIMIAMLIPPAGMEGILDFCLGCWMFGMAIKFKIVPPSIYRPFLNYYPAKKWAYDFANIPNNSLEHVESTHVLLPGQTQETPVDLIRKDRVETEYKNQDASIRHVTVDYYAFPLAVSALALVFKTTADGGRSPSGDIVAQWGTKKIFQALGIASGIVFGLITLAYLFKAVMWFKKIRKEWIHPVYGNFFSAITMCLTIFGVLLFDEALRFGIALIWIGAVGQMTITVVRVSELIYDRVSNEFITPALMMAPVGNFLSALALALYPIQDGAKLDDVNYVFIARLWFAVAAVFTVVLFTLTLHKSIVDPHVDPRMRSMNWIWMATFSLAGPAYLAVSDHSFFIQIAVARGVLYQSMWLFAVFLFAVNSIGWIRGFYSWVEDRSIWTIGFSCSALAYSTIQYYMIVDDFFTRTVAIIAIAIASVTVAVCFLYTSMWAVNLSLFKPRNKWGPVSFMKLTHEVFRFALPNLQKNLSTLSSAGNPIAIENFIAELEQFFVVYGEHAQHEDSILFPSLRRFHPGLNPDMDSEHELGHTLVNDMKAAMMSYKNDGTAENLLSVLQLKLPEFINHTLEHARNEESTITVVARKYLTLDQQKEITNRVWESTPTESWYRVIPYVLTNLPVPMWKIRYLKTFIWANPDRAQEIGILCYRTLNSLDWSFVSKELPEIVPRGLPGWRRVY